jgi:hypothetical protein
MSTLAQTITIIGSLIVVFGAQTLWILHSFTQTNQRIADSERHLTERMTDLHAGLVARFDDLRADVTRLDTRLTEHLDREHNTIR